ncbi:MAG: GSCFA domain-containing protein [Neomegalonema sp.]|nr:GSCFA domain-containing protein [Neomegalonema sp.]
MSDPAAPKNAPVNPYRGLADHQFWRRSVALTDRWAFDPVVNPKFRIETEERVATAGSCFAQHIARTLSGVGFNYFVPEDGGGLDPAEAKRRNFGVFSGRFGNIYTARQLRQVFEEAFGGPAPVEDAWQRPDGRWVDPYRPQVEPDGFDSPDAVRAERAVHLGHVRAMFEGAEVFMFTLGLTEGWRSRRDGRVFPLAPGVAGGSYDPAQHEFINFEVDEVIADMSAFVEGFRRINPGVKIALTVSPVPLIATYEDRNVLVSTTLSKSVLRVAADVLSRRFELLDYFPSFEIITGNYTMSSYYEADLREVTPEGVAHAMRVFLANYTDRGARQAVPSQTDTTGLFDLGNDVVCDEEAIDEIR